MKSNISAGLSNTKDKWLNQTHDNKTGKNRLSGTRQTLKHFTSAEKNSTDATWPITKPFLRD